MKFEWYPTLLKAANIVIARQYYPRQWEAEELVAEAWLNSTCRLDPDSDLKLVLHTAIGAMKQFIGGKKNTRKGGYRSLDKKKKSLFNANGDVKYDFKAPKQRFCYDDVDELTHFLKRFSPRTRAMILDRLTRVTQKEIALKHGYAESRVSQILQEIRR